MVASFLRHFRSTFPHLLGERVLVALSGGPDSTALLCLLSRAELGLDLLAVHVHHGVRGTEADEDAEACRQLCARLGVPLRVRRLDGRAPAPDGREAAWRRLRYAALQEEKARSGAAAVATGHHRDDVAEGVLVQLLRGAGPRALAGIAHQTPDGVIRPLLPWGRARLTDWLRRAGLSWREDSSNVSRAHLRNVVRHDVLPALEGIAPAVRGHLVALAGALAEDESFLADELQRRAPWPDPWDPDGGVALAVLGALPAALRTRWLHAVARRCGVGRVSRQQAELFHRMVAGGTPRAVTLARRWRVRAARSRVWLEPAHTPPAYRLELVPGETTELPLPGWAVRLSPPDRPADARARWRAELGPGQSFTVRSGREGDVVLRGGRQRHLRSLLAEVVPRHLRTVWPVVCVDDTITWVPGVWQSETGGGSGSQAVEVVRR